MRSLNGVVLAAIAAVAIILVSMATFIVNPTEQALILPALGFVGHCVMSKRC